MRKPDFCICENKDADQLRGNREADQRLCFRYTDSIIPLLPKAVVGGRAGPAMAGPLFWGRNGFGRTTFLADNVFISIFSCVIFSADLDMIKA